MSSLIDPAYPPLTTSLLVRQLRACGLEAGQHLIVHTRLSAFGWIAGGAVALIEALMRVITPSGTIMMPAFSADNSDPRYWQHPPIPQSWWQIYRDHAPAFDPAKTPTWGIGVTAELFRTFPGVVRSAHPSASFAAWGAQAARITADHAPEDEFGDRSPLARLYELDGFILLLGVDHGSNSSLHLAESRANWAGKGFQRTGAAVLIDGVRQWIEYDELLIDSDDFPQLGDDYEREHGIRRHHVGRAEVRFMRQRPLIDYAVGWLERNRKAR
jgi:aminoglycoside 3-N-acetyltransferase